MNIGKNISLFLGSKIFTLDDQIAFSKASGDFNPIHLDPILARRTIYGECIVHGIHGLIWALELYSKKSSKVFSHINVNFRKPIFLKKKVYCKFTPGINTIFIYNKSTIFSEINIQYGDIISHKKKYTLLNRNGLKFPRKNNILSLKVNKKENHHFYGNKTLACSLFSLFLKFHSKNLLYDIISLSEIVGMRTPGLNSIFGALAIKIEDNKKNTFFILNKKDKRIGLVDIKVIGKVINAKIKAFYRPSLKDIPSCKKIRKSLNIKKNEFKYCKALIIGGSRGIQSNY